MHTYILLRAPIPIAGQLGFGMCVREEVKTDNLSAGLFLITSDDTENIPLEPTDAYLCFSKCRLTLEV